MVKSPHNHIVQELEEGWRLDRWLKHHYALPFGLMAKWLRTGYIRVDGKKAAGNTRICQGQTIQLPEHKEQEQTSSGPQQRCLDLTPYVLYENEQLIVINKPAGLATQGGTDITTSVDSSLPSLVADGAPRPCLVHRLDKDTSGVLLIARNTKEAKHITEWFQTKEIEKIYWAVITPPPPYEQGRVSIALQKQGKSGEEKMVPAPDGLEAETSYRVLATHNHLLAWVELIPFTGRTHQLRAHCAWLNSPILGDGKYGASSAFPFGRPCKLHLHARRLILPTGVIVEAPLPAHMEATFTKCEWQFST